MIEERLLELLLRVANPVPTWWLAESLNADRAEVFQTLNRLTKEHRVTRTMYLEENGTPRPTLGFGWSCPPVN